MRPVLLLGGGRLHDVVMDLGLLFYYFSHFPFSSGRSTRSHKHLN